MAARSHPDTVAFRHRSDLELLTLANVKTPKGEKLGYLSAILYLMPHTSGGGATLCPHSTDACRAMCLAGAGLSGLPRQLAAKQERTRRYLEERRSFLNDLTLDILKLKAIATVEGLKPALRLNGTSDIMWEREDWPWSALGVQRYDYTKIPLHHRRTDAGYHLTYSYMSPDDAPRAVGYLEAGHSVAAVVPEAVKDELLSRGEHRWPLVDGDITDLRFLDPLGSIVLLRPKGHKRSDLIRPHLMSELAAAAKRAA